MSLQQHPPLGLAADRVDPPPSESSSRISVAPPPAGPRRGALLHLPPPLASPRIPPPSPLLARGGSERGSGGRGSRRRPSRGRAGRGRGGSRSRRIRPASAAAWCPATSTAGPPLRPSPRPADSLPPRPGARRRSGGLRSSRRRRPALRFAWVLAVLRSALAPLSHPLFLSLFSLSL